MKLAKKSLMLMLSILLLLAGFVMPVFASIYHDTDGHWAMADIEEWSSRGILNGYNGAFRPNDSITRAEFATILNNIMRYIEPGTNAFSDLAQEDWYYDAMLKLHAAGVLQGSGGRAMPEKSISRQEAAVMLARAFHIEDQLPVMAFNDQDTIAEWAYDSVNALAAKGAVKGKPDGSFDPEAPLTRAEAVTIIANLIGELYSEPGTYSGDVNGSVVVNADDVVLHDMVISGDLFVAQGVGEGEVTLNDVIVEGTVVVEGGGRNSIIFNNVQVRGALVVNKYNGSIRVLATGNTSVSVTMLQSGAMIVTRNLTGGGFDTIEIPAEIAAGAEVVLDGNFKQVVNRSPEVKITANGNIAELIAEADTNITGEVKIDKVDAREGVLAAINNEDVSKQPSADSPAVSPGSSSSGSNSGDVGGGSKVPVTGVSLDLESVTLIIGETKRLTAIITPEDATNKHVVWEAADGVEDVASVEENGLVTAIAVGSEVIRVTTEDGGFTDEVLIQVVKPALSLEVARYADEAVDPDNSIDATVAKNSGKLNIVSQGYSISDDRLYETIVTAEEPLTATSAEENLQGKYANLVVTVRGHDGQPITDYEQLSVTVTEATYTTVTGDVYDYIPEFEVHLADGYKKGSMLLLINAGDPEEIQQYDLSFAYEGYEETKLNVLYVPAGFAYITGLEPITGEAEVGAELTAGGVLYEGTPANQDVQYTWLRSELPEGPYTIIEGAQGASYVLKEADGGKYIRVKVFADQQQVGGWKVSEPIGPVKILPKAEEVFQEIEQVYLGSNSSVDHIVSHLNLVTSLSKFPDVTITWESSDESIISHEGAVTRSQEIDQQVTLTVTLDGVIGGEAVRSYTLTVKKLETNIEFGSFIDPYFAADYPQAYIKDGDIWVKFKLQQPAEVFMVVNAINGHVASSVKSVLEGHAGAEEDQVTPVDQWPYFHVTDANKEYDFNTGVRLDSFRETTRVEFVIRDGEYISDEVTAIVFTQEIVEYLDTMEPVLQGAYLNQALDAIYVYYNEKLDVNSVPKPEDFQLSDGQVTGVSLYNYDERGVMASYVKLDVNGIGSASQDSLKLSYTGNAIKDISLAGNVAYPFEVEVNGPEEAELSGVKLSANRKNMKLYITPGINDRQSDSYSWWNEEHMYSVTVNGEAQAFKVIGCTYSTDYFEVSLELENPLPEGEIVVTVDSTKMINFAMDRFPSALSTNKVNVIADPGLPNAVYDSINGAKLTLTFAEGYDLEYRHYVGGFFIMVDGKEYALRGFNSYRYSNIIEIPLYGPYEQHIKDAIENGSDVYIKYQKINGDHRLQVTDTAGGLLEDFDYIEVEVIVN